MGRNKAPNKSPEKDTDYKLRYQKGQVTLLKRRISNLEDRVAQLEKQILKLLPKKPQPTEEEKKQLEREAILKKYHPDYFKDEK